MTNTHGSSGDSANWKSTHERRDGLTIAHIASRHYVEAYV